MTTVPSEADADRLAASLVEARLAACVQITPIRSVYRWNGQICREPEYLLLIKTTSLLYQQLQDHIRAHHPYETPEVLQVPIDAGSPDYLAWITRSTS